MSRGSGASEGPIDRGARLRSRRRGDFGTSVMNWALESAFGRASAKTTPVCTWVGATVKHLVSAFFLIVAAVLSMPPAAAGATRNVVLIVGDGIRWEEVFTGADPALLNENEGGSWIPTEVLKKRYWRDDASERRKALMPFMWGTVAAQGQIFGNATKGSAARVSNGLAFSYPGYNEMITGAPDAKIDSNEFGPNPHVSVFEWLAGLPEYRDRVAVFGSWETFKDIFNERRSGLPVFCGPAILQAGPKSAQHDLLERLYRTTTRDRCRRPVRFFRAGRIARLRAGTPTARALRRLR